MQVSLHLVNIYNHTVSILLYVTMECSVGKYQCIHTTKSLQNHYISISGWKRIKSCSKNLYRIA